MFGVVQQPHQTAMGADHLEIEFQIVMIEPVAHRIAGWFGQAVEVKASVGSRVCRSLGQLQQPAIQSGRRGVQPDEDGDNVAVKCRVDVLQQGGFATDGAPDETKRLRRGGVHNVLVQACQFAFPPGERGNGRVSLVHAPQCTPSG